MRKPSRAGIAIPVELHSADCTTHLNKIIAAPGTEVDPDFYKGKLKEADGTIRYTVREELKLIYKNKCAYCEKFAHKPKIDHHRPKGRLVGAAQGTTGYYWLVYEWTNLLPSCTDCNSIEAKGSRFPVNGARNTTHPVVGAPPTTDPTQFIYDHQYNIGEDPDLLHPEYCVPKDEFDFDRDGKINGRTDRGSATVTILKLDNADLNGWRRAIYETKLNELFKLVRWYFRTSSVEVKRDVEPQLIEWVVALVKESENEELEYTLFRKKLIIKFDYFFIDRLAPEFQTEIRELFLNYIDSVI